MRHLVYSVRYSVVPVNSRLIIHPETNKMHAYCLSLLEFTYFGYSCDHLQSVPQYKCQEYNTSYIKCIIELSKVLLLYSGIVWEK